MAFIIFFCTAVFATELATVSIHVAPGANPKATEKQALVLAEKLQNRIKRPVQVTISQNYTGVVEALKNKKADLAVLTAMTYVVGEKDVDMKVLLKKTWGNKPFYYSALVVNAKSGIKKVTDLKNKTIAFVDEKSTSGYVYPQVYIRKNNLKDSDFKKIVFSGNHSASVEMLEKGEVDVIAVFAEDEKGKTGAWTQFFAQKNTKVRVLWLSEPIPNDPIVVRQDFYDQNAKLTHEIMYALIDMQDQSAAELGDILGTSNLMPATSRQYDPVRDAYKVFQGALKL